MRLSIIAAILSVVASAAIAQDLTPKWYPLLDTTLVREAIRLNLKKCWIWNDPRFKRRKKYSEFRVRLVLKNEEVTATIAGEVVIAILDIDQQTDIRCRREK